MDDSATTGEWAADDWEGDAKTRTDHDTPVEHQFLLRLRDNPDDLAMRMVFADWLEQTAQLEKAEVVRLLAEVPVEGSPQMTRLRLLGTTLDREWMAIVSRAPIDKCDAIKFKFQCPKSWESLTSTDDATVRHCHHCQRNVYFCATVDDVRSRARANECVAFSPRLRRVDALQTYEHEVGFDDGPTRDIMLETEMGVLETEMGEVAAPEDWGDMPTNPNAALAPGSAPTA